MLYFSAILINIFVYIILIIPLIISLFFRKIYENKKSVISKLPLFILINIILSAIIYTFSYVFPKNIGSINLAIYFFRIIFFDSSFYPIKFLFSVYLLKSNKKTAIILFSKIAVQCILCFIGYKMFSLTGLLYSFPICNIIYYFIYTILFLKS